MIRTKTLKETINQELSGLQSLDSSQQQKLVPILKEAREELLINRMEKAIKKEAHTQAKDYYNMGQDEANHEIERFSRDFSSAPQKFTSPKTVGLIQSDYLINNMEASLQTYHARIRALVSNAITQGMIANQVTSDTVLRISRFLNIKRWRIVRIVRTETHKIYNYSKLLNFSRWRDEEFPNLKKALFHPMDHRTGEDSKQLARLDPEVPLEQPFVFTYKRKLASGIVRTDKRVFMVPPDRPNDRASMVPMMAEWKK